MTEPRLQAEIELARLLVQRLERLSADSTWAHQASGYRGALLKCIEEIENSGDRLETRQRLFFLSCKGFELLEKAAVELTGLHPVLIEMLRKGRRDG
jgi:hypothetical protein